MAAREIRRFGAGDPNYVKDMVAKGKAQKEMKKFQNEISPKGVAAAEAAAKKAIEKKYPGMFIPETKIAPSAGRRP